MVTITLVLLLALLLIARSFSLHWNVAMVVMLISAVVLPCMIAFVYWPDGIDWQVIQNPRFQMDRFGLTVLRILPWVTMGMAIQKALVSEQFVQAELDKVRAIICGAGLFCSILCAIPFTDPSLLNHAIWATIGMMFLWDWARAKTQPRDLIPIGPLFQETACVFQGGNSILTNHHFNIRQQRYAIDLIFPQSHMQDPAALETLEQHACFGAPVLAPFDGTIVHIFDEAKDQAIGTTDVENVLGNYAILKFNDEVYALFAHLKQGSKLVDLGQHIKKGTPIAECGNSGNTSAPHLHFQLQNKPTFSNQDAELTTHPIAFENSVTRNGRKLSGPVFPRRNDLIG